MTVEALKEAAWKPGTHRAYAAKAKWWLRFLETSGRSEEAVDGAMLCDFIKFLFDESQVAPQSYPQYMSAVFHRLRGRHLPVPKCREYQLVIQGCQRLVPETRELRPPLLPSHIIPQLEGALEALQGGGSRLMRLNLLSLCILLFFGWRSCGLASIRAGSVQVIRLGGAEVVRVAKWDDKTH